MKYFYLFVLFVGIAAHTHSEKAELNGEQSIQIDCLVDGDQGEEKAVINKAIIAGTAYYIGEMHNEVMPMAAKDQFVKPVHKFGIEGRDAVPICVNDSRASK